MSKFRSQLQSTRDVSSMTSASQSREPYRLSHRIVLAGQWPARSRRRNFGLGYHFVSRPGPGGGGSVLAKCGINFISEDKELSWRPLFAIRMRVEMARVLTPEEAARSILAVFKASGARANQVLMLGTVDQRFLSRTNARAVDFSLGLRQ